jgi:hypothetical protein
MPMKMAVLGMNRHVNMQLKVAMWKFSYMPMRMGAHWKEASFEG